MNFSFDRSGTINLNLNKANKILGYGVILIIAISAGIAMTKSEHLAAALFLVAALMNVPSAFPAIRQLSKFQGEMLSIISFPVAILAIYLMRG